MSVAARLEACWQPLLPIGRQSAGGYRRHAWTDADMACRAWFTGTASDLGLAVETDRNGNLWAWWDIPGGVRRDAVVTGSHLDSVPDGGAYDGPLGVAAGLVAVDALRRRGMRPDRPIAVVAFSDEEGARFGVACVGSRLLCGALEATAARALTDAEGTTLEEAMRRAGAHPEQIGRDDEALGRIGVFVELHVEQGRYLAGRDAPLGVATAIWPHGRWRLTFAGAADHAGTTRLTDRRDPMLPFAHTVIAARAAAEEAGGLATVGRVQVEPNATNGIAAAVHAWVDARAPDDATVSRVVESVERAARQAAAPHGVRVAARRESYTPPVVFGDALRDRVAGVLGGGGAAVPALPTGAGHDAGILSAHVPCAMLFVRNPTGVSHSPAEHCSEADRVAGVEGLMAVLEDLACR